jgi:hypothetical protein
MLGKLRTRLSNESFRAGPLLRSWHKAGLLPEPGEMAQCLQDGDIAVTERRRQSRGKDALSLKPPQLHNINKKESKLQFENSPFECYKAP